jgi:CDP-4-dehydro-6-deoxyglucose reductase, E3
MDSWNITLIPGDHRFHVDGEETVLEAALRAGISVGYGCRNGNCGDCQARVVSGEVRKVRRHDYVFSESEKLAGYALMCSVTPVSDLVVEMAVAERPDQIPLQQITTSVRGIERPNDHVMIVRLQTPRTRRLRFLAGQQVRLGMDDGALTSVQPLANCPCDDRNLVLHLPGDPDDPFIARCFRHLRIGESVELEGPLGDFVLPDETPRPLLFLAANTGFGPVRSIVEHVLAQENPEALDLVWVADPAIGHYQHNVCRAWQDAMDNFHYRAVDWPADATADSLETLLRNSLEGIGEPDRRHCFIAGPVAFVEAAARASAALGIDPEKQHTRVTPVIDPRGR